MLSILIVNWNTRELLRACLQSIQDHPPKAPHEVIVVDNASSDQSAEMVEKDFPAVKLIKSVVNTGYAKGNNLAFEQAQGEWLLTLNPDTEVYEGTLDKAIERLQANPDKGALGAKQIGPDGQAQRSVRGFPTYRGLYGASTSLANWFPTGSYGSYLLLTFNYEIEQEAPQPMGTFLLFRRKALEAVGDPKKPFDEEFPIFFNEVDLLYRMSKAGWPAMYSPEVVIKHHGGESTKQVKKSMIWESHRSLMRFMNKHYRTKWNAIGLWYLGLIVYGYAFVRARGYHVGFRA